MATLADELFAQACAHEAAGNRAAATLLNNAHAEIERLTAALAAAPVREEKADACFCNSLIWLPRGRSFVRCEPCWINEDTDDTYSPGSSCPDCGAHLGADGVARRWKERE